MSVGSERSVEFGLAPMEGVSDWPFRLWFSQVSAPALMGTPFLRATDTFPKLLPDDFAPEIGRYKMPYKIIPQVMASRPEDFVRSARLFLDAGASFVDLNCGCPSPNPVSGGAGSSLLKTEDSFLSFVRTIAGSLPKGSFSVKMRTGFDDYNLFEKHIDGLRDLPLRQLTVHGRTRKDRYDGQSRWDLIERASAALPFPVVASGDVLSHQTWADKKALHPKIPKVIIGRGALRNPWLFEELRTGQAVTISKRTLILTLACFGRIMELSYNDKVRLDVLVKSGLFNDACLADEAKWTALWTAMGGGDVKDIVVERFAFGRTKMVWNSLRSSLPVEFFEPTLLRAKSLGEFLSAIEALGGDSFAVSHAPEMDWLYTSSRKKPGGEAEQIEEPEVSE